MKFSVLGYNQEAVLSLIAKVIGKNGKEKVIQLDVTDLLILHEISDFMNRKRIIKYNINDKTYFSVQYSVILEDLPILGIKKQALADRIDKMVVLGVLEKFIVKNQAGSFSAFRLTEKYEDLVYQPTSTQLRVQEYSTTSARVADYEPKDNITNTTLTNTLNKEKKRKEDLSLDFVDEPFRAVMQDWLDYKKAIKDSYKCKKSVEMCYSKLVRLSGGSPARARDIIEQSISNGWKGLFELKSNGYANNNTCTDSPKAGGGQPDTASADLTDFINGLRLG